MKSFPLLALAAAAVVVTAGALWPPVSADEDEYHERFEHRAPPWGVRARPGVAPVENALYREECGSCHMAYPPGLLPALSWERIMATLDDHFGENAELDEETRARLLNYLLDHSAGRIDYRLSNRLVRGLRQVPLRITDLPYFRHEHREIPPRLVTGNPRVRSFSNCNACHLHAEQGFFGEHDIHIPGYGRHEDD